MERKKTKTSALLERHYTSSRIRFSNFIYIKLEKQPIFNILFRQI